MSVRDLTILGCSSQQPTRYRNHGAYLVRWNGEGFLFDPGEGTQRQFIFANIAPTCVTRIFISHFHGDHCLGLGSMLMRLNLDKVQHPIHCYYPASGAEYFRRLRYGAIYHEMIQVIEHPVGEEGVVVEEEGFSIEAYFLHHGVDNLGWRIKEADFRKFDSKLLRSCGVVGPAVRELEQAGLLRIGERIVHLDDVSVVKQGDVFAIAIDTLPCDNLLRIARKARLFLCESTYLDQHRDLARQHYHLTAKQAALIAKEAEAEELVLTHFSARYQDVQELVQEAQLVFPKTIGAEDLKQIPFPRRG
ncbi:MAG: ribonuclease Z [Chlamydiae bacterium]|nr:ribonuclease Z [Chlamydiota bacterium]